ncbi:unnamed protein product [Closterium sp. Yama58-4]|nr:unnamed protein product [Closterium sp. Yama58-4]
MLALSMRSKDKLPPAYPGQAKHLFRGNDKSTSVLSFFEIRQRVYGTGVGDRELNGGPSLAGALPAALGTAALVPPLGIVTSAPPGDAATDVSSASKLSQHQQQEQQEQEQERRGGGEHSDVIGDAVLLPGNQEADLLQPNDTCGVHGITSSPLRSAEQARTCPVNGIALGAAGEAGESALGVVGGEAEIARGGGGGDGAAYMVEKARAAEATGDAVDGSTFAAIGGGGDPQDGKNGGGEGGEGHAGGKENAVGNLEGAVDERRGTPAEEALGGGSTAEGGQLVGGQPEEGEGSCNAEQRAVAEGESGALIQGEGLGDGEKEEAGARESGEGEGVLVGEGAKEACENGERGERKVRWLDDEGQTLTDVREFEPSESSSDDDDEHYKESSHKCSCSIL